MVRVLSCITQEHDLRLVALSACICVLGCFTTSTLAFRAVAAENAMAALRWHVAAATLMGCSALSLHFVGMLAYMPSFAIEFHVGLTALSAAIAVMGPMAALAAQVLFRHKVVAAVMGGLAVGIGVAGMHYAGAAAMRFSGLLLFDHETVLASVGIGLLFAVVGLLRFDGSRGIMRRLEVTGWLTLSICGLHFTGMSAMTIVPGIDDHPPGAWVVGSSAVAFWVGAVTLGILIASLIAAVFEQHLSDRSRQELTRMRLWSNFTHEALLIHRDGIVLELNCAGERLFQNTADKLLGCSLPSLFAGESASTMISRTASDPEARRPEEMEICTADGTQLLVELSSQTIDYLGKPATVIALRDLSDRKRDEARIRHLVRHDRLTDLPNRFNLDERLDLARKSAMRDNTAVAVITIDLDRFRPVNDMLGHAAGDALLVQVSKRLLSGLHPSDTVARIGGDEFAMVLSNAPVPEMVSVIAGRLLETLRRPFDVENQPIEISASLGIALFPGDGHDNETLMQAASTAMGLVKKDGGGAARFYEPSMNAQLHARRQLEHELAHAVERNQLVLMYQPMVNGSSGETETFEALIRWQHPERGMVPPDAFLPLAEQTDMMGKIGQWVIETACEAAAGWSHPWRVSVNVSPSQFRASDVPGIVATALKRYGLTPGRLVVEITEGVFIDDTAHAVAVLSRLRALGIRLALDDFGTGYSSLSYLQLFKFDKIKIDKSFVQRLGDNAESLTIVKAIVNLAQTLGLHVTAEGVETTQQLETLRTLGCDQLQGYLFGRPAPISAYTEREMIRVLALFNDTRTRLSA